jgi:hypothetical protein
MKTRPLGCMTFSALVAGIISVLAIVAFMVLTGGSIFSPGDLNAVTQTNEAAQVVSLGGVTTHAQLEGKCDVCHAPIWSGQKMGDRCMTCHADVADQSKNKTGLHGQLDANAATCLRCHTEHHGPTSPATLADPRVFPHDTTGFALASHLQPALREGLTCRQCHQSSPQDFTKKDCISCHQQLDPAKMSVHTDTYGQLCLNCHDGKETFGKAFAHPAAFPLEGQHAQAACAGCHKGQTTIPAMKATATGCIDCHASKDIHKGTLGTNCASCHTAKGWDGATLNHDTQTKFALQGKHAGVECLTCHVNRQWSGIGTTCASCHQKDDTHKGKFGADCASCHNPNSWQDAKFDHAITGFALTASHASTTCEKCHANKQWANTPTTCVGCHASKDKHSGSLGTNCANCHKPTQWSDAAFNHNQTSFKLIGQHMGLVCEKCHTTPPPSATVTTCYGCHQAQDTHKGSMGTVCETCHNPSSWKDASIDHSRFAFKLTGAHMSVTCQKCHTGGNPKNTPTTCYACHKSQDPHNGAFGTACETCHSTSSWKGASIDHSKFAFKLTGAHASVTCQKCHTGGNPKNTPTTCYACHASKDKHNGMYGTNCASCHVTSAWSKTSVDHSKFAFKLTGGHASVACSRCHTSGPAKDTSTVCASCHTKPASHDQFFGGACSSCHTTKAWRPADFNHAQTSYKLTGAHLSVTCLKCHPQPATTFQGAPSICESCHTKPSSHTGQMAANCSQCHSTTAWKPSTFSHTSTGFPLVGAHTSLLCTKCHSASSWGGLSATCSSCHNAPSSHPAFYGTTCTKCHTQTAFTPISYTATTHTFPMNHHNSNKACTACHNATTGLDKYTCVKCHSGVHDGKRDQSGCASCHPTGNGGD